MNFLPLSKFSMWTDDFSSQSKSKIFAKLYLAIKFPKLVRNAAMKFIDAK